MPHTHEFDCKICGEHLDSRDELTEHTRQKHPDEAQRNSSGQSATGKRQAN